MPTTKNLNFNNNGLLATEADDGSIVVVVQPKDPARNQYTLSVPAAGDNATSAVLAKSSTEAQVNVQAIITSGLAYFVGNPAAAPPTDFASRVERQNRRERKAALQVQQDAAAAALADLNAQQNAIPTPPAG